MNKSNLWLAIAGYIVALMYIGLGILQVVADEFQYGFIFAVAWIVIGSVWMRLYKKYKTDV